MPTKDRIAIVPSRASQVIVKQKLKSAFYGLKLMKRKRDALQIKLREIMDQLSTREGYLQYLMREAYMDLAKAKFAGYDRAPIAIADCEGSEVRLKLKFQSVVGVQLPSFEILDSGHDSYPLSGLARGGQQLIHLRHDFYQVLTFATEFASLQYSSNVLQKSVKDTSMRVNGLEYVLIPKFENSLRFIGDELDETEREDVYRIKKMKSRYHRTL